MAMPSRCAYYAASLCYLWWRLVAATDATLVGPCSSVCVSVSLCVCLIDSSTGQKKLEQGASQPSPAQQKQKAEKQKNDMTPEPMPHLLCNAWGLSTVVGASPSRNAAPGGLCPTRANPDLGPALSVLITDGRITPLRLANLPALPAASLLCCGLPSGRSQPVSVSHDLGHFCTTPSRPCERR